MSRIFCEEFREYFAFEILKSEIFVRQQMRETLLSTCTAVLAEATVNDNLWGIGLDIDDPDVFYPERWKDKMSSALF